MITASEARRNVLAFELSGLLDILKGVERSSKAGFTQVSYSTGSRNIHPKIVNELERLGYIIRFCEMTGSFIIYW